MSDGDRGHDHSQGRGDGEHAPERVLDSERGHDHAARDEHAGDHDEGHHESDAESVAVAVVTISSTRRLEDDDSGDAIVEILEEDGHEIVTRDLIRDDFDGVQGSVARLANRDDVEAVVTSGGTGVTPDDVTPEAIDPLMNKRLPGFGEEFRRQSVAEVGPMGMLTRACAGVMEGTIVVVLPGSESAARTGTSILVSVLGHLVGLANPDAEEEG